MVDIERDFFANDFFKTKLPGKFAYDFFTSNKQTAFSYLSSANRMRFVNQHE